MPPQILPREVLVAVSEVALERHGGEGAPSRGARGPTTHLSFFASTILPPFALQSAADVLVCPCPLQAFLPAQE